MIYYINKSIQLLALTWIIVAGRGYGQEMNANLIKELERIKANTVLILPSNAIDGYPMWSVDSRYVAANIMGKWYKVDVDIVKLESAAWVGKTIGVNISEASLSEMSAEEVSSFIGIVDWQSREVKTKTGIVIELRPHEKELGVRLAISQRGEGPKIQWTTTMENCFGLVLSPDERFVAYLCASNGMFLTKLPE